MSKLFTRSRLVIAGLSLALLAGCAIHQNVNPIIAPADPRLCLISNPATRDTFQAALKQALTEKGFDVQVLPPNAALNSCPLVATYQANWRWDLAMYMAYAEIKVYGESRVVGQATYDATRGGGNMGKFISAEKKIVELVNQLFPGGPQRAAQGS